MNKLLPVLLSVLILSAAACEKKEERILPKVDSSAQSDAGDQLKLERDAFIQEAQKEFDELGDKLIQLRKKAVDATGSAREKLNRKILALEQEQKDVAEKLANLKSAIGENWMKFKSDFTTSFDKFKQSVKDAI